jgi:lipopolysaccharide transport system ATP-binding protein
VTRGEIIGIIGRNGAGKSTLLKILSRITEPTAGRVRIRGRVASLLEVGTGFHPDLTGRENVFLNGAILGMTRAEIERKFDEIVAFSGVERFIDTPVKRYSSGMSVRLAFAVAAHLEPEILIIDEVLAVGDAAFQRKCLGKMDEVAHSGRTVLIVSHNMAMVTNLCQRSILLQAGRVAAEGETSKVVTRYLAGESAPSGTPLAARTDREGKGEVAVSAIEVLDEQGYPVESPASGQAVVIRCHFTCKVARTIRNCQVTLLIKKEGQVSFILSTSLVDTSPLDLEGDGHIDFIVPEFPLGAGTYDLNSVIVADGEFQDTVYGATQLGVVDGDFFGTGRVSPSHGWRAVGVLVKHRVAVGRRRSSEELAAAVYRS